MKVSPLAKLSPALPSSNAWWRRNVVSTNQECYVLVWKPNSYDKNYSDEILFQPGEFPDFILKDLEQVPWGEEAVME